jgi:chorismate-pyruvate lyase
MRHAMVSALAAATFLAASLGAAQPPLSLAQTLNDEILASTSATLTLEQWCRDRRLAANPTVVAELVRGVEKAPAPEQRERLGVSSDEPVRFRHVRLRCGTHTLSEADNWYVPARLTADMNRQLDTTDTPFGKVVQPLQPHRKTFSVRMLWSGGTPVPDALFEHRAVLYTRDERPFSEVDEMYQRQILE